MKSENKVVDADRLRKYIADWREGLATAPRGNYEEEMLYDLEDMLPTPPAPRTMAEVEWSDEEHHLAEATAAWAEGTASEVVMLHRNGDTIAVHQSAPHYTGLRELNPAILTPTGRKYRLGPEGDASTVAESENVAPEQGSNLKGLLDSSPRPAQQALARDIFGSFPKHVHWAKHTPEDDVAAATGGELTTQDVVDECRAVRKERATPEPATPRPEDVPVGEAWQVEIDGCTAIGYRADPETRLCWAVVYPHHTGRHWMYDSDVTLIARLVPETTEQDNEPMLHPDYIYSDRDGDEWEYLDGQWITGNTHAKRVAAAREDSPGIDSLLAEFAPYTRIDKEEANE